MAVTDAFCSEHTSLSGCERDPTRVLEEAADQGLRGEPQTVRWEAANGFPVAETDAYGAKRRLI